MPKLKPLYWIIIISLASLLPLILVFVITRILLENKGSWWWFFGCLIIEVVIGGVIGIIYFFVRMKKPDLLPIEYDPQKARERAIHEKKYDTENPDNFIIDDQILMRVGEPNSPRTPILWLHGSGSESNESLDAIIKLDTTKFEISWLVGATEEKIKEAIRLMADNPETEEVSRTVTGRDAFGNPIATIVTKKISKQEKDIKEQEKQADEQNMM